MQARGITQRVRLDQREMGNPFQNLHKEQKQNCRVTVPMPPSAGMLQLQAFPNTRTCFQATLPKGFLRVYLILSFRFPQSFPHPGFSSPFMAHSPPSPQGCLFRYNPFNYNEINSFQERIKAAQMTLLAKKKEIERRKREAKL